MKQKINGLNFSNATQISTEFLTNYNTQQHNNTNFLNSFSLETNRDCEDCVARLCSHEGKPSPYANQNLDNDGLYINLH